MNLFQKMLGIKNIQISKKGITISRFSSNAFQQYGTNTYGPLANKDFMLEYKNWVFACVTARSEEVGNIKLRLFKGDKEIIDHPVLTLLNAVNPQTTKHQLFEYTQSFKDLNGNAFWFLARNDTGKGDIQAIYLLRPDRVRIVLDKQNPLLIQGYLYRQPDGQTVAFAPNEILHHKNFNPTNNFPFPGMGMGIVEAASYAIDTDNEARKWNLNFFRNGARPEGVLITDGEGASDAADQKRLREEWDEEYGGSDNAHKIAVLSGGLKYQKVADSATDMDFNAGRLFNRDEILSLFRVPKSIIGITDDVNRANAEASIYVFALRTITPLMQKIVDTLNEFLLPEYSDDLKFAFVSPVPEDQVAKSALYSAAYNNWMSRNDIRRAEGLEPTENGDKMYIQGTLVENDASPVPEISKHFEQPKIAKSKDKKVESKSIAEQKIEEFMSKKFEVKSDRKSMTDENKNAHIDGWKKRMDDTGVFRKDIKSYFSKQEKEVQSNLKTSMRGLKPKEFVLKDLSDDVLFNEDYALKTSIDLITPYIKQWLLDGGNAGNAAAQGSGFDAGTKPLQDFLAQRSKFFSDSINGTTKDDLLSSIQEGISQSESLDQLSQRISDVYGIAKGSRTDMIARTEVAASSNFGAVQAYKQAGVTKQQWIVVDPEDEDCLENDGVIVDIGDEFPSGDTEAPIHPNCQCTTVPVFDDEGDDE